MLAGCAVAGLVVTMFGIFGQVATGALGSDPLGALAALLVTGLAGGVGGWIVGPAAGSATTKVGRAGVVLLLASVATMIGSLTIGLGSGFVHALQSGTEVFAVLPEAVLFGLLLGLIGMVWVGPFVLPFTVVAAVVWLMIMSRFQLREAC
jgi:hypothetical protein